MKNKAVSNNAFYVTTAVLIIIALLGFLLYANQLSNPIRLTSFSTLTTTSYSTITSVSTTISTITKLMLQNKSGAFYNGEVITILYTGNYSCSPPVDQIYSSLNLNITEQSKAANGCGDTYFINLPLLNRSALPANALPVFLLLPAFADISIFGYTDWGATPQGFPVFNSTVILTHCGAGGTIAACPNHITNYYTPVETPFEQNYLNIYNGTHGLPEGVLPIPAYDILLANISSQVRPWYFILVPVYDPNIFPNPLTGKCSVLVPSNLTDPTGNCLNNIDALKRALQTCFKPIGNGPLIRFRENNPPSHPPLSCYTQADANVDPSQLFTAITSNVVVYFSTLEQYPYP